MNRARITEVMDYLLMAFAFFLPISIALTQAPAYLVSILALIVGARAVIHWKPLRPVLWMALGFALFAIASTMWSIRPGLTLSKLDRFLLLALLVAIPWCGGQASCGNEKWAARILICFLAGVTVQALMDLIQLPWHFLQATSAHDALVQAGELSRRARRPTLFDMGNMRDPQFYMVSLSLLTGWVLYRRARTVSAWWWVAMVLNAAAFILHFKRGAWLAFIASTVVMALLAGRRRVLVTLFLLVALALALPPVRDRLTLLKDELRLKTGGRYALWTEVAPNLFEAHPHGLGWKAARHEDFTQYKVKIQPKLNHLHDNILQIRLELGWPGVVIWGGWMLSALVLMVLNFRRGRGVGDGAGLAYGILGGFLALQLNGLVEYNFGDSEIYMLLIFLMAMALQMRMADEVPGPGSGSASPTPRPGS